MEWCMCSPSVLSNSLRPHGLSPPGSSIHWISQARILEWADISFSRGSSPTISCIGRWILYHWATMEATREVPVGMVGTRDTQNHMAHVQEATATQVDINIDLQKYYPSAAKYWYFPRDTRNLDLNVKYSDFKYWQIASIVTKGQYRLTKQDPQTNADGPIPLVNHQFLISDLTHNRCSTNDDQMNFISILYMGIWSSVLSVIGFSAPSVKQNLASRSSSSLSSSPFFFIIKLLTNVFSINYCNQSAATFTGQENTSTTVRRPDNHDFHLSNMPSLPITMQLHPQVLLLLLSCFSRVRLRATPETEAHQAPPSLGFSGQEHWSGLPFPSPVNESEKWKGSRSVVSDS